MGLTVLHPTGGVGTQEDLKVDIVAVHGLNGHPIETWTNEKTRAFWLKDFLPLDIVGARVMTFGYNANVAFETTTADINDHAKDLLSCLIDKREEDEEASRPLLFIAHSLGGIIVKKALFAARIEAQYHSIFQNTLGILFLGTPHRGSEKAKYGNILANVATAAMHKPSSRLISALKTNSHELLQLTSEFRHQLPNYQVVSFYEMKPMKRFASLIVEKHSALLEVQGEDQIPINANHVDMCKFAGRDDEVYEKLSKRIGRMVKGKCVEVHTGIHVTKSRNKHYELPRHVSPDFTGRKHILQKLKEGCLSTRDQKIQSRAVLHGMGGSGKTQICLKFAQDNRDHFWGIFWIDASSNETAERGFVDIARICGFEADFTAAKRWLANLEDPWLLIIDNADDPRLDVLRYFPTGDRGTILLTTRNPDCKVHATSGSFEIHEFELEDAITLLLRTTEADDAFDPAARNMAKPVVETLGCLALAIVHAGAVIRQGLHSMEEYCQVYSRRRKALLSRLPIQTSSDYKYAVYTTFEISFKKIEDMSDNTSRNAIEILQLFCFFHHSGISEDILKEAWKNMRKKEFPDWTCSLQLGVVRQITSQEWDPYLIREAIKLLSSFSLLTVTRGGDHISMQFHPLVHTWARDRMDETEQKQCWLRAASTLAMSINRKFESRDYQHRRSLKPHLDSCLDLRIDELFVDENAQERLDMTVNFFLVYNEASRWQGALELQERVVERFSNARGEEDAQTLRQKSDLGDIYLRVGKVQKAAGILEQVLNTQRRTLGEQDPDTPITAIRLAICYFDLGQYHESRNLIEDNVEIMTRLWGEEDHNTLTAKRNLALSLVELNQVQKAKELLKKMLEVERRVCGEEHPNTLITMSYLARSYSKMGQVQKAAELEEKALEIQRRVLGEEHLETLISMSNLAVSYSKLGQNQRAAELDEKVLDIRRRVLGEEHEETLGVMKNLAVSYSQLGQDQRAAELEEKVLDIRRRVLGEEHEETLSIMKNLAVSYSQLGQDQRAAELEEKVLDVRTRVLGEEHADTLKSLYNLATSYHKLGHTEEAIKLCDEGLEISMRTFGEQHPLTVNFLESLAYCHQDPAPSLEVSSPYSLLQITTDTPLGTGPWRRGHFRKLLTKLHLSTGSR